MGVPTTGKFKMFGTGSDTTIEGAISSSVVLYDDTDRFSGSAHLIGDSISNKFDVDFSRAIQANKINISSSLQYRGYPITTDFGFTMKCLYTESATIPDPDPLPDNSGSLIVVGDINGDTIGFGSGTGDITGSNSIGDDSWPVSSSYDIDSISCDSRTTGYLELSIDQNGDSNPPPTFTSMTISGSDGSNTYNYCDLISSGSLNGPNYFTYRWDNGGCPNFTSGNQISITFNTASVDYFTDCDPAIATNGYKFTAPYIDSQIVCDDICSFTRYFHTDDVSSTNPVSVGDVVYTDAEGRNEFNGLSKYHGVVTSSANTTVPDVIVRIASDGYITEVLECVQTTPYEPPLDPASRDCNSTVADPSGIIINHTYAFNAGEYNVHQIGGSSETTQAFLWSSYDRPNKFTLYDDSSTFANPIYSTGWVGKSTYNNAAGKDQWSTPLDTNTSGSQSITWGSTTGRKVRVDYGYNNGTLADLSVFSLVCTSSLQPLNVAVGNSWTNVCAADIDDDIHYHFHTTSSDFLTKESNNIMGIARVFDDTTGLNPILKNSSNYYAYTSSAGTKYAYAVNDRSVFGLGEDQNMGVINYHQKCSGTEVAVVRLTSAGDDCDDANTTFANNSYIASNFGGFDVVNGVLKIDNDNLSLSNRVNRILYNDSDSINYDPRQIIHDIDHDVDADTASSVYLVHTDSLKNTSGTKLKATVTAGSPALIKFEPCTAAAGGCTEFAASSLFFSSDFAGSDPTGYKCALDTPDQLWIDMSGNEPAVGDGVYSTDDCSSYIDESDVYFTIYSSILDKTWIILMDSVGEEIDSIWTCTADEISNAGDNTYYLSTGYNDPGDNCGGAAAITTAVTSDATSITAGANQTVYSNGSRFNGGGKYYLVSTTSYTSNGDPGDTYQLWKISSTGIVTDVSDYTCPLDVLTTLQHHGCIISLGEYGQDDVEGWEVEHNGGPVRWRAIYANKPVATRETFPAGATFSWEAETSFTARMTQETVGYPNTSNIASFQVPNSGDTGYYTIKMTVGGVVRAIGQMYIDIVDEGTNDC